MAGRCRGTPGRQRTIPHADLSLWRGDAEGRRVDSVPYLTRIFRRDETREIRLYLDGVGDSVTISGEGTQRIKLRIIANRGDDVIHPTSNPETEVYHPGDEPAATMATIVQPRFGGHITFNRTPQPVSHACEPTAPRPPTDLQSPTRDWGTAWIPIPALGYVSGLGVYAGVGVSRTNYAFQAYPFKSQHVLWGVQRFPGCVGPIWWIPECQRFRSGQSRVLRHRQRNHQ